MIVVRLKFVTLPDLLWGHVLYRFSSLFFPLRPRSFFHSREYLNLQKNGGNSASKFRAYVSNRPQGRFHATFFRFTPCHLFIPCLVSHYFSRCISKCSVLDDPRNRFIGLYIYIAFRVASFGRRDLLRKSFVEEKSWRKYKSEYIKHRLG